MSEVRGSGREYQTAKAQKRPRGATPRPRSGGAAERSYPASEVRVGGREELPHAPTPPHLRPGVVAGRTNRGCAGAGGPRGAIPR